MYTYTLIDGALDRSKQKKRERKQQLETGIKKFNRSAKKGMEYLGAHGFVNPDDPQDVARFLRHTNGLNKTVTGDFLSLWYIYLSSTTLSCLPFKLIIFTIHSTDMSKQILQCFLEEMNFAGLSLDEALRCITIIFRTWDREMAFLLLLLFFNKTLWRVGFF